MSDGVFTRRRERLTGLLGSSPVLLLSGWGRSRNFPANLYPFRASSHFLFFGGPNLARTALLIEDGQARLFVDFPTPEEAVWESFPVTSEELCRDYELDRLEPTASLVEAVERLGVDRVLSLPVCDAAANQQLESLLGRLPVPEFDRDRALAEAVVELRLRHDEAALEGLGRAARATVAAHRRALEVARPGMSETEVLAHLVGEVTARGMGTSFSPIVSVHGEVLHNPYYTNHLRDGDLLLVDFGAETSDGWAGDVTRTFPVGGSFTSEQRDLYDCVLATQQEAIEQVQPGRSYLDIHMVAALTFTRGLVELGLLRGSPESLVERGAHTLFFPHGLGHLLGLDVHDMEDLGDLAGYAPGRSRPSEFGTCFLRLDRKLEPGMLVTIEPGFYWIPQLLADPERVRPFADCLDTDRIAQVRGVRGIRIEDEVLVTADGHQVLTADLPKQPDDLEGRL